MTAALCLVAVDEGARACCEPLLALPGCIAMDASSPSASEEEYWRAAFGRARPQTLFCGTSDSARGRAIESAARRAARSLAIRIVALEDFPGNYRDVAGGEAEVLIAESEASAAHYRAQLSARCPELWICASPRYDAGRRSAPRLRAQYAMRDRAPRRVLWAGQPETADALVTLRRVLPALGRLGAMLLFRAYPRDAGYREGEYEEIIAGAAIPVQDVSALALEQCFALSPELVLTQFSSVGVEAGFHGIPSVNLLYPEAGGRTLYEKKGYRLPPWCDTGAAFLVERAGCEDEVLGAALDDPRARQRVLAAFDAYFSTAAEALPALVRRLYNRGLVESEALEGRAGGQGAREVS